MATPTAHQRLIFKVEKLLDLQISVVDPDPQESALFGSLDLDPDPHLFP
jgi:hypothetical protein